MYKEIFDVIALEFSRAPFHEEYEKARSYYFSTIGNVFQENPLFDTHITGFLEVYLFERPLDHYGVPPVRLYEFLNEPRLSEAQKDGLKSMRESVRSIYEINQVSDHSLEIEDVIRGIKYEKVSYIDNMGLEKGQLIDARLIKTPEGLTLTESLWVHATHTKPHVLREIKKTKTPNRVYDIAYMKWRKDHFPNAPLEQTYSDQSLKFRKYGNGDVNAQT